MVIPLKRNMGGTAKLMFSLHVFANFLQFLLILDAANASGLSIKLIHRHSIESPFYPGYINRRERIKLLTTLRRNPNQTIIQSNKLIRPMMGIQGNQYLVEVGFGTFFSPRPPHYKYFLHLDTASDVMWVQCKACQKMGPGSCFLQAPPLFPADGSNTYRPLRCGKHPLCNPGECVNGTCTYFVEYGDGAKTFGYLASETLTFHSDGGKGDMVKDVIFGCGIKNKGFVESSRTNLVVGNFGLGFGKHSFMMQQKSLTLGRFSYCLPPWDVAHNSTVFLRFGDDILQTEGLKDTPLMTFHGFYAYFVELKGISVGDRRLVIPQRWLSPWNNRVGGCMVDSGSSVTVMPSNVYEKLKEMLVKNHFFRYERVIMRRGFLHLCYLFPRKTGLRDLPNITFHLRDSDMVFLPQVSYIQGRTNLGQKYFCLAMFPADLNGMIIVGALQQANTRFIFDTKKQKLYFGPEDCTRGA